jgi:hypothetical protein
VPESTNPPSSNDRAANSAGSAAEPILPPASDPEQQERMQREGDAFMRSRWGSDLLDQTEFVADLMRQGGDRSKPDGADRDEVWARALQQALAVDRQFDGDASREFDQVIDAAKRGQQVTNVPVAESYAAIADALYETFPTADFEVRCDPDPWGAVVTVIWSDGPARAAVADVCRRYTSVVVTETGAFRYAVYETACERHLTPASLAWAEGQFSAHGITRDPDEPEDFTQGIPEGAEQITVAGVDVPVSGDPSLDDLIFRLLERTDR